MEKFRRNINIIDGELDGNQIMMHIERGKYFGLNKVGKRIWELVEQPRTFEEITSALLSEFDVSEIQCRREVEAFIENAVGSGIIIKDELAE